MSLFVEVEVSILLERWIICEDMIDSGSTQLFKKENIYVFVIFKQR